MTLTQVVGFGLAVLPFVLTPGSSFTLVTARGAVGDRRGAWATIAGTAAGIATHAALAGAGLAAVVMRSAQVYQLLRLAGAAYLIGLGLMLVWRSVRRPSAGTPAGSEVTRQRRARQLWAAYVANVLNVKAASVYLTLAPQFIPASSVGVASMTVLAAVHIIAMAAWLGVWSMGLTALTSRVDLRRWLRWIEATGGAILVFLGLRTARASA